MAIRIGTKVISKVYVGTKEIGNVYVGTKNIFPGTGSVIAPTEIGGLSSGFLYMTGNSNTELYRLNTSTGAATRVGLARDAIDRVFNLRGLGTTINNFGQVTLYMLTTDKLFRIAAGAQAIRANHNTEEFAVSETSASGLAGSPASGLYMVGATNDVLYTLNATTEIATRVGSSTAFGVNDCLLYTSPSPRDS